MLEEIEVNIVLTDPSWLFGIKANLACSFLAKNEAIPADATEEAHFLICSELGLHKLMPQILGKYMWASKERECGREFLSLKDTVHNADINEGESILMRIWYAVD